jgi:hypothetical protein
VELSSLPVCTTRSEAGSSARAVLGAAAFAAHGDVFYYSGIVGDGRVNRSDGLVAYAGAPGRVLWVPRNRRRAGSALVVTGRRLDGGGT